MPLHYRMDLIDIEPVLSRPEQRRTLYRLGFSRWYVKRYCQTYEQARQIIAEAVIRLNQDKSRPKSYDAAELQAKP